jgi:sugar O-acyltransferase (sialic acid O-acetyltransferase NeuD family)
VSGATIYIVGSRGHGRVILDVFRSAGGTGVRFLDDDPATHGAVVDGVPVAGGTALARPGTAVLLGVGDNIARRDLYLRLKSRGCAFPRLIAPSAVVSPSARIDEGSVVFARTVIQTGARIGVDVVVNTAAVVEHDCLVDAHAQLAPAVALSGGVRVGEGTLLGTGVSVNKNVSVGAYCLVSPGLPVIRDVPDRAVYKVAPSGITVETNYRVEATAGPVD